MTIKTVSRMGFFAFLVLTMASCSSSSGEGADDATEATNALAVAYPDDLAVSSITASSGGSAGLMVGLKAVEADDEFLEPIGFVEKKGEIEGMLTDPAAHPMNVDFTKQAKEVGCYGPNLYLGGGGTHPDGPIIPNAPSTSQNLPTGDLGIWEENEDGEACIAAQMNKLMADIENYVNVGLQGAAATLGAANAAGLELPVKGEGVTMTDEANAMMTEMDAPITMTEVVLNRDESDTSDGFPVFQMEIGAALTSDESGPGTMEMSMTHIPEIALADGAAIPEDTTYCGRIQQKVNFDSSNGFGGLAGCDGATECISISYCKNSDTSLTYHMRRGQFCGQSADCFNADGDVDPANKKEGAGTTGWGGDFLYVVCDVNPTDGSGDCSQAWQAGAMDGNSRTFNVSVDADGTGCGYFGYGPDVEDEGVGTIDGMICNWAGPGAGPMGSKTLQSKAQKQCFTRNAATGVFESDSDTLAITYAPTNSCDKGAASFAYGTQDPPTDVSAATAVTNNLIPLADVDFTLPALPTVPE